jgi:hypothetical protein
VSGRNCTNCGRPWRHSGSYCHHCGQEKPGAEVRCALQRLPSHFGHESLLDHLLAIPREGGSQRSLTFDPWSVDFVNDLLEQLGESS